MKQTTVFCVSLVCVVILISLVSASSLPSLYQQHSSLRKHFQIEKHCAMIGGLCAHKDDCEEPASTHGLCPDNQALGAECCYRLRPSDKCAENAAECMPYCNEAIRVPGTECDSHGQFCCILV